MPLILILLGISFGILIGIFLMKFCVPWLDIKLEVYSHKESLIATDYQIKAQTLVKQFEKDYPEQEETATSVVGYDIGNSEMMLCDCEEDEDCDCEDKKIGFKL